MVGNRLNTSRINFLAVALACAALLVAALSILPESAQSAPISASGGLRLIGTIEGKSFTGAVLDDTTGKQAFYRLHETLPDGSVLVKVRDDSITVKSADGALYDVYVSRDSKSASLSVPAAPAASAYTAPPEPQANQPPPPDIVRRMHQRAQRHRYSAASEDE